MNQVRLSRTGPATAEAPGAIAISGVGNVHIVGAPTAHSYYREQIAQIAPEHLRDRDMELGELASFSTDPDESAPVYQWWRAPKWSGKTALMATFALHPPPGVRIAAFFITARWSAHATRDAFVDIVSDQLAEILGEPSPTGMPPAVRDGYLPGLLARAAQTCRDRGERLVLLVDGLDEDRGTPHDQPEYGNSIAAALPIRPPAGMRVVVAGRPHPVLPADVPDTHPLRSESIRRPLETSEHARVAEDSMLFELHRLLHGSPDDQDLLGLLTAARGGLTAADLVELTNQLPAHVHRRLRAVTGRTFDTRTGHWRHDTTIYLLGHEDLQVIASEQLGEKRLEAHRQQLHTWGERYQNRRWPPDTPDYLLRGYYQLLRATNDLTRMVALATDVHRQDRMLHITGGDTAALAEINTAQDLILATEEPDLLAMANLTAHRDQLLGRNQYPYRLPSVWATLGQSDRAEALTRSMHDNEMVVLASAEVAKVVAGMGDRGRAAALIDTIKSVANSTTSVSACWQARRLAAEAETAAAAEDLDRAEAAARSIDAIADSITDTSEKALVLAAQARAVAACGDSRSAGQLADAIENLARTSTISYWELETRIVNAADAPKRVATLAHTLHILARAVKSPQNHREILTKLAKSLRTHDSYDYSTGMARAVERIAHSTIVPFWQVDYLQPLMEAVVASGHRERITQLVDLISDLVGVTDLPFWRDPISGSLLFTTAEALTVSGDRDRAIALADNLRALANAIQHAADADSDIQQGAWVLLAEVEVAAQSGDYDRAETLARSIIDPYEHAAALTSVARAVAAAGNHARATPLVQTAENLCRTTGRPQRQAEALATLAKAAVGDQTRAARVAYAIESLIASTASPYSRAEMQVTLVEALTAIDEFDQAKALTCTLAPSFRQAQAEFTLVKALIAKGDLRCAEALARAISDASWRRCAGEALMEAAADAEDFKHAETLIEDFADEPESRVRMLTILVTTMSATDNRDRVSALIDMIQHLACTAADPEMRDVLMQYLGKAMALSGRFSETENIMRTIVYPFWRSHVLTTLVKAAATSGDLEWVAALATRAEDLCRSITSPLEQSQSLTNLLEAIAASGDLDRALLLTESIPFPGWRARALSYLATKVEPTVGKRSIARALAMGNWSNSIDALAQLSPSVVLDLIDALVNPRKPQPDSTEPVHPSSRHTIGAKDPARHGNREG